MDRRSFMIAGAGATAMMGSMASETANAAGHGKTGFLLVHGSWHGAWCWGAIEPLLRKEGHLSLAIDLPGCGLKAVSPPSYFKRPLDMAAFASEPSQFASLSSDDFADAVLDGAAQLKGMGADKIVAVGHSMGGMPITLAAAKDPSMIQGLVFLTGVTTVPGRPSGSYFGMPEQVEGSKLGPLYLADPAVIGGLRIDTASSDPEYTALGKEALAEDVPDALWATAVNMMHPDAPAAFYGDVIEFPVAYGAIDRTFIRCGRDKTIVPALQDAWIADMTEAWPENPCRQIDLDTSHEGLFADPAGVADALLSTA